MTPPRTLARYRAFTGSRPHPPRGVGDAAPYNGPKALRQICRGGIHPSRAACGMAYPRQMFHVEHLPDFFVGKTPFLSLLFVL